MIPIPAALLAAAFGKPRASGDDPEAGYDPAEFSM